MKLLILAFFVSRIAAFSPDGQAAIVKAHNDLRSAIAKGEYVAKGVTQPGAKNMMNMVWDDTIAASAHNSLRAVQMITQRVSTERIFTGDGTRRISEIWTNTVSKHRNTGKKNSKTMDGKVQPLLKNHTTLESDMQLKWLGRHPTRLDVVPRTVELILKNGMNKVTVVCQYQEKGNTIPEKIYEDGEACSSCPSSSTCEVDSKLCA